MSNARTQPVVTAKYCKLMERITIALEVLFGVRVFIRDIDFNSWVCNISLRLTNPEAKTFELRMSFMTVSSPLTLSLAFHGDIYFANFNTSDDLVKVYSPTNPAMGLEMSGPMNFIGTSYLDRYAVPYGKRGKEFQFELPPSSHGLFA